MWKVASLLTLTAIAHAQPPPKEVADFAKSLPPATKCTGKIYLPSNVTLDTTGSMTTKLAYDGWWIQDSALAKSGKQTFRFDAYTTYDAQAKKWRRVLVDNAGGYMTGWSDGPVMGKMDFAMDGFGAMGAIQMRDHLDASDPKAIKTWAERSSDKGKTWDKDYETTCKR